MNFVAIDFETANSQRVSACAMGFALVENGAIVRAEKYLIKPPRLRFEKQNTAKHGIDAEDVLAAPTFKELWPVIRSLIESYPLVAHSVNFDGAVLYCVTQFYKIPLCDDIYWIDSLDIARLAWPELPSHRLDHLAQQLEIPLSQHHDAHQDAIAAAYVVLRAAQQLGCQSLWQLCNRLHISVKSATSFHNQHCIKSHSDWEKELYDIRVPQGYDLASHPFFGKRVAFTGEMKALSRALAAHLVKTIGGNVCSNVSRKVNYLVATRCDTGKYRRAAKLKEQGFNISIIGEAEFLELVRDFLIEVHYE